MLTYLQKKEISTLTRSEIIINNFFNELKKRKISASKYALDNNINKSVLSKWKNHVIAMSIEQVYQAAEYFNITANDLYYSEQEKKKLALFATETDYSPIKANQTVQVKIYDEKFKNPFGVIKGVILFAIIITIGMLYGIMNSGIWASGLLSIPIFMIIYSQKNCFTKRSFVIGYLDDIYYKIDNCKDKNFKLELCTHILSLILLISGFTFHLIDPQINYFDYRILIMLIDIAFFAAIVVNVLSLVFLCSGMKSEIYDNEIDQYRYSLINVYIILFICCATICMLPQFFTEYWYIVAIILVTFALSIIEFVLISKKFSEYRLMYKENDKAAIYLPLKHDIEE